MCRSLSLDFAETFRLQFLIAPRHGPAPEGYVSRRLGRWGLFHCPALPVTALTDAAGTPCGYCLGRAVDGAGHRVGERRAFAGRMDGPGFLERAEAEIADFAGRYTILISGGGQTRVYGDPAGALPLVCAPDEGTVASSLLPTLTRDIVPNPLYDTAAVSGVPDLAAVGPGSPRRPAQGGFSFGHTADRDVFRLAPNHRLCLETFRESRFWPPPDEDFAAGAGAIEDIAAALAARLGIVCNALAGETPAWFALSGGVDSRMLLAAAEGGFGPNMRLYAHGLNRASYLDTLAAQRIADHLGREIRIAVPEDGPAGDFRDAEAQARAVLHHDISAGFVAPLGEHVRRGALAWIPRDELLIRGNMLELASAVWWPAVHKIDKADPVAHAVVRCQVAAADRAQHDDRMARMESWMSRLPENAAGVMHDFNYIENTLPYTQSGLMSVNHCLFLAPACDRRVFALCMAVPFPKRRRGRFFRHVMRQSRPDLLKLPLSKDIAAEQRAQAG